MRTVVDCIKQMGLQIGDTIEGRDEYGQSWDEARLTLLWHGEEVAVWRVSLRKSVQPDWRDDGEDANWTLDCREWSVVKR